MTSTSVDNIANAMNGDYGAKLTHDPSWTGPLSVARKITNKPFIVAFFLCVVAWIGITVYVFSSGDEDKKNNIFKVTQENYTAHKWNVLVATVLSLCLSILFLVLLRVAPKKMASISSVFNIVFSVLTALGSIYMIIEYATSDTSTSDTSTSDTSTSDTSTPEILSDSKFGIALCPLLIVQMILCIRMKIRNSKLIPVSCEIIREATKQVFLSSSLQKYDWIKNVFYSRRIILSFPSIIAYAVLNFILFYVLLNLILLSYEIAQTFYDAEKDDLPAHVNICVFVKIIAYVWINAFLFEMFRVTVAGTYGTWYWTENKRDVPRFAVLRFIYIAIRL
uniref:Choline transporter-like protein n=1 Tax=Trichogramma kaykai TaxID=54128 RepID=A0ABD2WFQ7_9HYME